MEGCFKMYAIDDKGNEHNLQFATENDWITDIGSFHSEKPSQLYIEAIEPILPTKWRVCILRVSKK